MRSLSKVDINTKRNRLHGPAKVPSPSTAKLINVEVNETIYTSMAPMLLPLTASAPSTACYAHWVLYPFFFGGGEALWTAFLP